MRSCPSLTLRGYADSCLPADERNEWERDLDSFNQGVGRKMRAAIYARVSSERQEKEHTIGSQLEALRAYAGTNGMEIVEEFTDEGFSGARLDRPALDRMRDLAERRGFEVLLTYCTDRLARKFVLQALILDELERLGVKTIFLEGGAVDDPLSKLMHQITGAVAEFERAKITERYRRGKLYRARCGEIVSPDVPFGYVKIPRRDGVPTHAEIQETEAVVIRRIFDAYVKEELTVRQIAKRLTLDRTPTPRSGGGQWSWSAVDRILHEEAYIGTYYYNRKHCVPIEGTYGKKRQRFKCTLRSKEEWIPISVPPIIDLATFQAAAGRARENEAFSPRNLQEGGYLLRKLVRCGRCGCSCSALTSKQTYNGKVHSSHYYSCLRRTSGFLKQERCSQRHIRADVLDELVWEEVSTRLQDPALVLEAYQDHKTQRRDSSDQDGLTEKDERLNEQIKLVNKELSRLLDAYQCGALELPELQKRRQLVNSKLEMLNREQELLRKMAGEKRKETDIKASLGEFAALVSGSIKRISFENKQKLLRMVVDQVVVNDWRVDVHYNIPLPKPTPPPEQKVSTKFDLRSTCIKMLSSTFCDELGYLSLDQQTSNLFYQVISTRHAERRSTVITTNTIFSGWGNILFNTTIAAAIADRLVENSGVFLLGGPTWRNPKNGLTALQQ
jgi:site-specific DNA recombinase